MTRKENIIVAATIITSLASFVAAFALNNLAFIGFPVIIIMIVLTAAGRANN